MNINKTTPERAQGVYPFLVLQDAELVDFDERLIVPQGLRATQMLVTVEVLELPLEGLKQLVVAGLHGLHGRRLSLSLFLSLPTLTTTSCYSYYY